MKRDGPSTDPCGIPESTSTCDETEYSIRGQLLAAVTSARYLGITITDKVNWSQHIDSITNKANRTLAGLGGH
jgi:hypothetical protein